MAIGGASLPVVGGMLGHSQPPGHCDLRPLVRRSDRGPPRRRHDGTRGNEPAPGGNGGENGKYTKKKAAVATAVAWLKTIRDRNAGPRYLRPAVAATKALDALDWRHR